jgi:hypothetical protein
MRNKSGAPHTNWAHALRDGLADRMSSPFFITDNGGLAKFCPMKNAEKNRNLSNYIM